MNKPIDELSLCKSCNCMTKTMNTSIKTYCGKCGADKPITEEQVALHYRIFVKVMSSICESNPKIQGGKPCIRGTRFTLNEIEGAVKDLIELSKQEERARIIPKIHKIRAGCPAKSFARQQAKELLKELMEVEK